jgi:hypothetical protein
MSATMDVGQDSTGSGETVATHETKVPSTPDVAPEAAETESGTATADVLSETNSSEDEFAENHAWLKLERVELPTQDIDHLCDSDDENSETPDEDEEQRKKSQTLALAANFVDATKGLVFTEVKQDSEDEGDDDDDDDDDYIDDDDEDEGDDDDEDDEVDELLEETMFALQNKYYFLRRIVCHGFVSLYKAIDRTTKERVCVKLVVRHGVSTQVERLPIEARVLACIAAGPDDHAGKEFLQKPVAYYSSPSTYVIVSKLYKEASFRRSLFDNTDDIKILMKQMLLAIDYLETIGIISRDVKNSNLLWDKHEKKVILCDFDLSSFITEKGHCVTLGTDGFIAAEVLLHDDDKKNKSRYSKEIDIYSAGVVFGSLLHGVRENELTADVVEAWRSKLKRRRNHLTTPQKLLRKMLCVDPANRPSAKECLEHDYFGVHI